MKFTIPNPCNENWNNMTPQDQGRFCGSCQKNVVDFTSWPAEDIFRYFNKHRSERVCGRFRTEQLQTIVIQIPQKQFYLVQPGKYLLLALFLAFGSTLFSCTDLGGNKRKIDRIEVVENTEQESYTTMGISIPPPIIEIENTVPVVGDVETISEDTAKIPVEEVIIPEKFGWVNL